MDTHWYPPATKAGVASAGPGVPVPRAPLPKSWPQQYPSWVVVTPHRCRNVPGSTSVNSSPPPRSVGESTSGPPSWSVGAPLPQQYTSPDVARAHVLMSPTKSAVYESPPETGTGTSLLTPVLWLPSWPASLSPQQ